MKRDWGTYGYCFEQSFLNMEYSGDIIADFKDCNFESVVFSDCVFNGLDLKNCTFINCVFGGASFKDANFVRCSFYDCDFSKGKNNSFFSAVESFAIDCIFDKRSAESNPLTIHVSTETIVLSRQLKEDLFYEFSCKRPELAVEVPGHCLSCCETQETHEEIPDLLALTVNDFTICKMSVETFSADALLYYMPRLLELLLLGEENDWQCYRRGVLSQMIPNKFGDRFGKYEVRKIELIIGVLQLFKVKYNKVEETWDYEQEMMTDARDYKEELDHCEEAISFWKEKLERA